MLRSTILKEKNVLRSTGSKKFKKKLRKRVTKHDFEKKKYKLKLYLQFFSF